MNIRLLAVAFLSINSVFAVGCGAAADPPTGESDQAVSSTPPIGIKGGLQHVYARPDKRLCPAPECGGDWLVPAADRNACNDQPSTTYVAGIFAGDKQIDPPCSEELPGFLVPDPRDPSLNIFQLEE